MRAQREPHTPPTDGSDIVLVLTRQKGQEIVIGDNVVVRVVQVHGKTARLGIIASKDVPVRRAKPTVARMLPPKRSVAHDRLREEGAQMFLPMVPEILEVVQEELIAAEGAASHCREDACGLFLWARLPAEAEVRPDDIVGSGIAVAAHGATIQVRHHVLRRVCRNGAIMPQVDRCQDIRRVGLAASNDAIAEVTQQLRAAVRLCASVDGFNATLSKITRTTQRQADLQRDLLRRLPHIPSPRRHHARSEIVDRFIRERDPSVFGLLNAVTSLARDERDLGLRWRLEELAGAIACGAVLPPTLDANAASAEIPDAATEVGTPMKAFSERQPASGVAASLRHALT